MPLKPPTGATSTAHASAIDYYGLLMDSLRKNAPSVADLLGRGDRRRRSAASFETGFVRYSLQSRVGRPACFTVCMTWLTRECAHAEFAVTVHRFDGVQARVSPEPLNSQSHDLAILRFDDTARPSARRS